MIKKFLILVFPLILVSFVFIGKVNAQNGNPWDRLWAAIENLQNQIDNLTPLSGPTGATGPEGPLGATGPQGATGPAGALNTYRVTSPIVFVGLGSTASTIALCQPGDQIISGGFFANGSTLQILQSRPDLLPAQGWYVEGSTANPPAGILPGIGDIAAFALCNDVTP